MPVLHTVGRRRSNKGYTTKAIKAMTDYLRGSAMQEWKWTDGRGTAAHVDHQGNFVVTRSDQPILRIVRNNGDIDQVCLLPGQDFDQIGAIDAVTREVQNGMLDALSHERIIPPEVRICYDHADSGRCYVVCKEQRVVLDRDYCTMVSVKSDPMKFQFGQIDYVRPEDREQ